MKIFCKYLEVAKAIVPGTELTTQEKLKAADLRIALLMGKIPEDFGLLVDTKTLGHILSISS
jgi:hypothetical protein